MLWESLKVSRQSLFICAPTTPYNFSWIWLPSHIFRKYAMAFPKQKIHLYEYPKILNFYLFILFFSF
jgi:hypothetical protein